MCSCGMPPHTMYDNASQCSVVPFDQRTIVLGVQWIIVRICGSIPGPLILGGIIDGNCVLWSRDPCTGAQKYCLRYADNALKWSVLAFCACMPSFSVSCTCVQVVWSHVSLSAAYLSRCARTNPKPMKTTPATITNVIGRDSCAFNTAILRIHIVDEASVPDLL